MGYLHAVCPSVVRNHRHQLPGLATVEEQEEATTLKTSRAPGHHWRTVGASTNRDTRHGHPICQPAKYWLDAALQGSAKRVVRL